MGETVEICSLYRDIEGRGRDPIGDHAQGSSFGPGGGAENKLCRDNVDANRTAYREFLELWRNADKDVPLLKLASAEYARLQQ